MWPRSWIIGESCHDSASLKFDKCDVEDLKCLCGDRNYLASVALCIAKHATNGAFERDDAWSHFAYSVCEIHNSRISDADYQHSITYLNQTSGWKPPSEADINSGPKNITQPISITDKSFKSSYRAVENFLYQKDVSVWQGSFLVGWWVFVIFLSALSRLFRYLHVRFALGRALSKPGKLGMAWQKHFLMPACFGWRHMIKIKFMVISITIPTRFDVVVIAIYFLLNVIFLITQYDYLDSKTDNKDPLYPTQYKEMLRFASDRSGIIGVIQMPLFTLFALRNNLLIWITG
jgi:hypothetical protein